MKITACLANAAVVAAALLLPEPAVAQTKPRTFAVSQIQTYCTRTFSDQAGCARIAEVVRQKYGDPVTVLQWNSAAGIVRHQRRQGKI